MIAVWWCWWLLLSWASPEQDSSSGRSQVVRSSLLHWNGGSLHSVWLHFWSGLPDGSPTSGLSLFFFVMITVKWLFQLLFDDDNDGIVNGFVWQHFVTIQGGNWEHPTAAAILGIVHRFRFQIINNFLNFFYTGPRHVSGMLYRKGV